MTINTRFKSIELAGWRQFRSIDLVFHDRLTIITGANGAGKSTILRILKGHFAHESRENFLATPIEEKNSTIFSLGKWLLSELGTIFGEKSAKQDPEVIGSIKYADGQQSSISLPPSYNIKYMLGLDANVPVAGVYISSHRALARYEPVSKIPVGGISPADAFKEFNRIKKSNESDELYIRQGEVRSISPLLSIKETLISFAVSGSGNEHYRAVPELAGLFERFQDLLKVILPRELGFTRLEIRAPEVVVLTESGEFPIDGASGGLMSLIEVSWQIFLYQSYIKSPYVALLDEPENHLHPSMQRSFLNKLVEAFPSCQFIVATHSPFIVSSVKDSIVYALRHTDLTQPTSIPVRSRSVVSIKLDQLKKAGPAAEILRDVLGVPVTLPEWSAKELEEIADRFSKSAINVDSLSELRTSLESAGLEEFYPYALDRIMK